MDKRLIITVVLLVAGALAAGAQEVPVTVPDGPVLKVDSLETRPAASLQFRDPFNYGPLSPLFRQPSLVSPLQQFPFETKAQRAARLNASVYSSIMGSVGKDLYWHRMPKFSKTATMAMYATKYVLSNPFGFPQGCVPLMNPSFPFIYAYTPGLAPYERPYSPENYPQSIRLEFDMATGTYKQTMVDWNELEKNMARSFGGSFRNDPVPRISVTPVERMME